MGKKAYQEACILGDAKAAASSADKNFTYIPDCSDLPIREDASYLYICENNTIYGTAFAELPNTKGHVLVADQSSMFLSQPCDVTKYGLIHAGVQKNVGPAGVQIVIVREDLIPDNLDGVPTMLRLQTHAAAGSLYNTPPAYGIYICGKVFKWIEAQGGLAAMDARNRRKADWLYHTLDKSEIFSATVQGIDRSRMNIPFVSGNPDLDAVFIKEAAAAGLVGLKGHRSVGGMRASIYNAMPDDGVKALIDFITDFEKQHC
ncbi:3-phosphoserine/phosphohydroxythreonine transaminase [Arcanobacterium hippocoleae]